MRSTPALRILLCAASYAAIFVPGASAVDGRDLPAKYRDSLVATQVNPTSFGDTIDHTVIGPTQGSEIDALYARWDATNVWLGITGNLPDFGATGQAYVILIDSQSWDNPSAFPVREACCMAGGSCANLEPAFCLAQGGARGGEGTSCAGDIFPQDGMDDFCHGPPPPPQPNTLIISSNLPGFGGGRDALVNLNGTVLEPGFYPERAVIVNRVGSETFVDSFLFINLAQDCFVGENCFDPVLVNPDPFNNQDICVYFDTSNVAGVDSDADKDGAQQATLAGTAITGLRVRMSRTFLGAFEPQMKFMVILSTPDGTVSNQIMPPLQPGATQPGLCLEMAPNFEALPGIQLATLDLTRPAPGTPGGTNVNGPPPLTHQNIPLNFGEANRVGLQQVHTCFGNAVTEPRIEHEVGSEMDQLFLRMDDEYLHLALTGNLQSGGNKYFLFFDADPAVGESVLDSNGLETDFNAMFAWTGRRFDAGFAPERAYTVSHDFERIFIDRYDLLPNTQTLVGDVLVGSGSGVLANGTNPGGDEFAFDNSNMVGVLGTGDLPQTGDPATAKTGLEARIALSELGVNLSANRCTQIKIMAIAGNGLGEFLSNQCLPSLQAGAGDLGDGTPPPIDFNSATAPLGGQQFATVQLQSVGTLVEFIEVLIGTNTNPAAVTRADVNHDGAANGLDIRPFLNGYLGRPGCP